MRKDFHHLCNARPAFLEKHSVKEVLREKGLYRTFLLNTLLRFLCDQFDRATAIKRGGGVRWVPWERLRMEHEGAGRGKLFERYRAVVRAEVANTVATPAEFDEEMRYVVELITR